MTFLLLSRSLLATALLLSTAVLADDDDDMPDGDADLAEKPKKVVPKKEARKEAKKEPRKAQPKKEQEPEQPQPGGSDSKGRDDDDDDILVDEPVAPVKKPEVRSAPPADIEDSTLDEEPPVRAREAVKEGRSSLPTRRLDDETPPIDTERSVDGESQSPPRSTQPERPTPKDNGDREAVKPKPKMHTIDSPVSEPDEAEGAPTGLIMASAIGGVIVVLAGAGVGGYFIVQALQTTATGTVVITPR